MKLVVIYGPPVLGKLTIAKELSKIINYKVFHNHLTVDMVESVIDSSRKSFWNHVNKFRYDMINILHKEKINIIFTCVYDPRNPGNFKKISQIIKRNRGKIYFVQLCPKKEILLKRVKGESRKKMGKLKSAKKLLHGLKNFEHYASFPNEDNLKIDNSYMPAKKVAQEIKKYFNLK